MAGLVRGRGLLVLLAFLAGCGHEPEAPPPPPASVKVSVVLQRDMPDQVEVIGETRGNTEIEVRARVEGFLQTIDFKEGSLVEKDQLLYTIDSQPFEARLAQAKASLAQSQADLARAHQDVARYEPLVAKNAISRQEYETAVSLEIAAKASTEASEAVVKQAQIDLSYTRVTAPEAGLVGRTEVYPGTLVGGGESTLLTRISRTDPIHVRFSFSEKDYLIYAQRRGSGVRSEAEKAELPFEMVLPDGSVFPQPGHLVFVDRNVDTRTGTIMAEAAFPNPAEILRPGQYVRVRATVGQHPGAILVPQRAVQELQGVFSVMVVGADDTVEQRLVTPGGRHGSLWVIASGLRPDDRVIVDGLQKVRPGVKVAPQTVLIEEEGQAAPVEDASGSAAGAEAQQPAQAGAADKADKPH